MKKYEYKVTFTDVLNLNAHGKNGWEYSHPHPTSNIHAVLKRELLDENPKSPEPEYATASIVLEENKLAYGGFTSWLVVDGKRVRNVIIDPATVRRDINYIPVMSVYQNPIDKKIIGDKFTFTGKLNNLPD